MANTGRLMAVLCSIMLLVGGVAAAQGVSSAQASDGGLVLEGLRFSGVTVFEEGELLALVSDALGKEATLADLDGMAEKITRHYREAGYPVARAHVPAQTVEGGIVHIAVVEGRYGDVRVDNNSALRDETWRRLLSTLAPGSIIRQDALDRSLLILNDLPGVRVGSALQPGTEAGHSDLLVRIEDDVRWSGNVGVDNFGNHSTGSTRLQLAGGYNNPFGLGDRLYGSLMLTEGGGMKTGRIGYAVTAGTLPLEIDTSVAYVHYTLGGPLTLLDAKGETTTVDVTVRHPLVRTAGRTMHVTGGLSSRNSQSEQLGETTTKAFFDVNAGLTGVQFFDGSALSWAANATFGNLDIGPAAVKAADAAGPETQGSFTKLEGNIRYQRSLNARTRLGVSGRAQVAFKNLDDSEKFSLGGSGGVKAYPPGEAGGDSGLLAGVDVSHVPAWTDGWLGTWSARAFLDVGTVKTNAKPWPGASDGGRTLAGLGVGVNWTYEGYSVGFDYGCKLGDEVATSAPDESCRLWLQAGLAF